MSGAADRHAGALTSPRVRDGVRAGRHLAPGGRCQPAEARQSRPMVHCFQRTTALASVALVLAAGSPASNAQVFKCVTEGRISLQQAPCMDGERLDGVGRRTAPKDRSGPGPDAAGAARIGKASSGAEPAKPGGPAAKPSFAAKGAASSPAQGE